MTTLSSKDVQNLVTKAFVLEAITDKPGCTTRYEDLAGKPLQDFIIAGINASGSFADFTTAFTTDSATPIFSYNLEALKSSNWHKSPKNINFGLLEIMFPTVAARLVDDNPDTVINTILDLIKKTTDKDVDEIMKTRKLAWSTSTKSLKFAFPFLKYESMASVWEFYEAVKQDFEPETSHHQWCADFEAGLPTLRRFFEAYSAKGEVLQSTQAVFLAERAENPHVSVGIVADMCAAAIFLWLSFYDKPV